ncbi:pimeloyl-ACP methyl ester carboxylesterase [Natronospira proteinivora]|uniref:Pimeloyl-ACP methyl ester carboxylesterase n=1 Tax=Natronospira proteinivora TaxID=1807133 RepID=A0ABT1GAM0_9GAMM|nr:alpha/beta hydrolase [Natronospira proteinivora]MCP1727298.1 pimeloyl-ACP methyl ester carboxylesterase [Natronospira proteinivora]
MKATLLSLTIMFLASACSLFTPRPETPMPMDRAQAEPESDTLLVLLPGRQSRGPDFRKQGFLAPAKSAGLDVIAADAHFGYYLEESVTRRLHEDIVQPAREQGYEEIWLMGISLGGLGAALYLSDYPGEVDGLILLAPYTGADALRDEIADAGGLMAWNGQSDAGKTHEREAWRALQHWIGQNQPPRLIIGYGEEDSFAKANQLIADPLPAEQVYTRAGRHNWSVWTPLWEAILDDHHLPREASN